MDVLKLLLPYLLSAWVCLPFWLLILWRSEVRDRKYYEKERAYYRKMFIETSDRADTLLKDRLVWYEKYVSLKDRLRGILSEDESEDDE